MRKLNMNSNPPSNAQSNVQPLTPLSTSLIAQTRSYSARHQLTPRETEVLEVLVEGVVKIKDVADRLRLSPNTVNNHINSIFMKTRTSSKPQLMAAILNFVSDEFERIKARIESLVAKALAGEGSAQETVVEAVESAFRKEVISGT
jgi:DNA-binding CsgD family transcriptional regulator